MDLLVFYIPYFLYPLLFIATIYFFLRVRFSYTNKGLIILRFATCIILCLGATFLISKDALNASFLGEGLILVFFPPLSGILYLVGSLFVVLLEIIAYYFQKIRKIDAVTKNQLLTIKGLFLFFAFSFGLGIFIQFGIYAVYYDFPF
jgi:hypothetical protein